MDATRKTKRDSKGRFVNGSGGGPGRPPAAKEQQYLEILRQTVDPAKWQRVIKSVLSMALEGNLRAVEILAKYVLPLPAQRLRITEEPREEYRVAGASPAQISAEMLARIWRKVEERQRYEASLQKQKIEPPNNAMIPNTKRKTIKVKRKVRRRK